MQVIRDHQSKKKIILRETWMCVSNFKAIYPIGVNKTFHSEMVVLDEKWMTPRNYKFQYNILC